MSERHRHRRGDAVKAWLTLIATALALALSAIRCAKDVTIGVDPGSDAAIDGDGDGNIDGGNADGGG